jgi:hypothetical protein
MRKTISVLAIGATFLGGILLAGCQKEEEVKVDPAREAQNNTPEAKNADAAPPPPTPGDIGPKKGGGGG